ncbi:MAG: MFS transporter [Dehalococcoidales bacterium]
MSNESASRFRRRDYVKITIFGFAITALWQSLHSIILPLRLLDIVPEAQKNTYLGLLTLSGLLVATFVQPIAGAISDRSSFKWGRRRPYVLAGGIIALLVLPGIGLAGSFAAIFAVYCLLQAATNTAQGPYQAFIPECVPENKHGVASGVKALLEVVGGVSLVYLASIFMDRYSAGEGARWLWLVLGILAAVLLAALIATIVLVKEAPARTSGRRTSLVPELFRTVKEALANRDIVWFLASRLLIYMAFTTIQQFAMYYLRDVIGVANPAEATARFSIFAVAGMLAVVWPAGYLSDKIGRKSISAGAGLIGAAGIGIIAVTREYGATLWAAVIIGMAIGAFNSANWALATDLVAKGEEARYLGIANMATTGGAAFARVIGPVIDFFNHRSALSGYNVMLMACAAYFIIGAGLVFQIRRHRSAEPG